MSPRPARRTRTWRSKRKEQKPPLAIRRPRRVLAIAAAAALFLGVLGLGVEGRLSPTSLSIPGTESQHAADVLRQHFGDSAPFAVLLRGPADQLDLQGPELVAALRQDPKVTTVSPWDRGTGLTQLRAKPNQALILVDFHVPVDEAVTHTVPHLNEVLDRQIRPPVIATQSGFASISRAIQDESISATQRGELIAIPILLIVLMLVFRSPIAASIPLAFGAITVLSSRGLISLLTHVISIDGFALAASSMMGLALGVDYALLMVSRFREELASGADPPAAALTCRQTAGRTTVFAGSTLLIAMLVSVFLLPGSLLVSLAGTVVIVTFCAVAGSWLVGPALLTLVGDRIDRWHISDAGPKRPSWLLAVDAAMQRPKLVGGFIAICLLFLAAPALALKTGPPSTEQLPRSDPARQDADTISNAIGPGWSSPFILVAQTDQGTMTDAARLRTLTDWQRRIAAEPGVEAVIGPGAINHRVAPLRAFGQSLLGQGGSPKLDRLFSDLTDARGGIRRLRLGLSEAGRGSSDLAGGGLQAQSGAAAIAVGLDQAAAAGTQATSALASFASGTNQLANAQQKALLGALAIKFGASDLGTNLETNPVPRSHRLDDSITQEFNDLPKLQGPAGVVEQQLHTAFSQLQGMTVGQTDPNYPATLNAVRQALAAVSGTDPVSSTPYAPGYSGLPQGLSALRAELRQNSIDADEISDWMGTISNGLKRLRATSARLYNGLRRIKAGTKDLAGGAGQLSDQASSLGPQLGQLDTGANTLAGGLGTLSGGLGTLERKLIGGYWRTRPLQGGLARADATLTTNRRRLRHQSPGLFDSGYFVLSALQGAPAEQRRQAASTVDLNHGGQAALIVAIPKYGFNTAGSTALDNTLQHAAAGLARDAHVNTALAGGAAQLTDYAQQTRARIPLVIAVISLITFLALILILRALPLAAIAVALNLVTVAAAFGVLVALGSLPEGLPFGGHDFVDAVGAAALFGVCFGLSIDYAVFLLVRMREHLETGDGSRPAHDAAIAFGLEKTAGVITGAAAIMAAVFMAYAIAPIATISQFGIGLTVAVLLDATVIRLILLPILMRMIGPRVWWLPARLERTLPRIGTGATATQRSSV
jgi:RND superfamily putative drug exporter